ncbi:MAG: tyrosine-type recombinase/integrase [Crocinitomicaceae bacterium]|nr:tyrosine-type recombinase/integrase [Crocinitomicaceae bacterium]
MLENFESYLLAEKRCSMHTVGAYLKDVSSFKDFLELENEQEWQEVNYQNVRSWIVFLVEKKDAAVTVNRKLSSLRTFFKWLKSNGNISVNPMQKIKGLKAAKPLPYFVKETQLEKDKLNSLFPETLEGTRDRLLIEVFYQTGMRLSELIALDDNCFNSQSIKVLGKRNKERWIPISNELQFDLFQYVTDKRIQFPEVKHLFCTDSGKKLYPKFVYRKINFYLSNLTELKKKSPHVLRHTFATHMLNNGAGLEALKDLLGHASLSATQIYTHNSFKEISRIYKQAHPRGHKT